MMYVTSLLERFQSSKSRQKFSRLPTSPLDSDEGKEMGGVGGTPLRAFWSTAALLCVSLGIALLGSTVGYFVGRHSPHEIYNDGLLATAGTIPSFMRWNNTFSYMTPKETRKAWNSLYPDGLGLITHPTLAPDASALAVYHQLHCLQMIYAAYEDTIMNPPNVTETQHVKLMNVHGEHCFDYLRQAIICAADTTLEHVDPELYGYETALPKKCRNIEKVAEFAAKWKTKKLPRELANRFSFIRALEKVVYNGEDHVDP